MTKVPGHQVLAPWAEDGFDYQATLQDVDAADPELCTVSWADGGDTCRVVPRAAVTGLDGSFGTADPEQRLWAARMGREGNSSILRPF